MTKQQTPRPNATGCLGDIQRLAATNPVLAFPLLTQGEQVPQIFRLSAAFVTGAVGEQIDGSTEDNDQGFCSDFVILGMQYQIRRNNAFAGSIFKGQSDVYNALNSGINVEMHVQKCPKFDIIPNPTPIELVASPPGTHDGPTLAFPYGFVAPECSSIIATFTNTRGFQSQSDLNPTEVWISFRGLSLGCSLETIDLSTAVEGLAKAGILDPKHILVAS